VDDPYQFGRIAAANSLSDIYAMGGTPITAMNIVGFPDKELPGEILHEILRGGSERAAAAGAVILGGHSVRDAEIKYGLSVTGAIHPDRIVANNTAQPGDVLVLTKPIGSGVLTSAAKKGVIPESGLAEAIEVMTTLNKDACEAMLAVGVHSATDVTGFGLLGHAYEMADGSGLTLEIDAAAVPLLGQAYELAKQGILTRTYKASRAYIGSRLLIQGADERLVDILADAQTSGGLLISVSEAKADRLVAELTHRGTPCAAIIGKVRTGGEHAIVMR
jgi:selenide,water dikinase